MKSGCYKVLCSVNEQLPELTVADCHTGITTTVGEDMLDGSKRYKRPLLVRVMRFFARCCRTRFCVHGQPWCQIWALVIHLAARASKQANSSSSNSGFPWCCRAPLAIAVLLVATETVGQVLALRLSSLVFAHPDAYSACRGICCAAV